MSWVVKESEEVTQKIPPNLMIAAELSIHPPHTTAEGIGAAKQVSISWGEFDTALRRGDEDVFIFRPHASCCML